MRISLVAVFLISLCFAAGWTQPVLANDGIMSAMGLKSGELITIDQEQANRSEMAIKINGKDYTMDYTFFSTRTKQFQLLVQQPNGEIVEQAAPSVSTIRGSLRGVEGSRVVGCVGEDGCCVKIEMPSGEKSYIEPVSPKMDFHPAFAGVHVVYTDRDLIPSDATCATAVNDDGDVQMNLAQAEADALQSLAGPPTAAATSTLQEVVLALDADFEYYTAFGSTEATLAQLELIINVVNDQYESEVGIRNTVSRVMIWATADDPYIATDAGDLLTEFRDFYRFGPDPKIFDADLCHLFTGKNLDGSTVGVAFLGVVCSNFSGYGLSQNFGRLNSMTDLVAHELGHNWNADHCTCQGNTMNAFLTSSNTFNAELTIPVITAFRDSRNCLTEIDPASLDDFIAGTDVSDSLFDGAAFSTVQNINATTEADEPDLVNVGSTVWFTAEPDEDGSLVIDTFGSDFDTQLHAYEIVPGNGLADLVLIDDNNNSSGGSQSEVTIEVTAGTSYAIRVGGFRSSDSISSGSEGNIVLNGEFTPAFLLGDVNRDGLVNFLDISPFIVLLSTNDFQLEADIDGNGIVNFLDISPFIVILSSQ